MNATIHNDEPGEVAPTGTKGDKLDNRARLVLIVFVCLLVLMVLFCLCTLVADRVLLRQEAAYLEQQGMVNLVSVGGHRLNVLAYGREEGAHTIVVLAGLGVNDASVRMRPMTAALEQENKVVYVDRAGYGLSDDTATPRTNDQIVHDYRLALTEAGHRAPYVLLAHSIGSVYATYWQSLFPDEIEAVIFVDGTQLSANAFDDEEPDSDFSEGFERLCEAMGWHRLAFRKYNYYLPDVYSERDQTVSDALNVRSMVSDAQYSESALKRQNARQAYQSIVTNDIPKLYICASWGYMERDEFYDTLQWVNALREKNHLAVTAAPDPVLVDGYLERLEIMRQEILRPYVDKLGNCELAYLAGDHAIYEQKPQQCAALIVAFLNGQ